MPDNIDTKNPRDVVRAMTSFVNTSVPTNKAFVDEMSREHRTLQQNFTRLCITWLERLATVETHNTDMRNEASVALAKEFVEKVESRHLPYV